MVHFVCPDCGGNIRTMGLPKGTRVKCRHCGLESITIEDNTTGE